MARFMGLSPYSNPIEAGIDSFAKLSRVFQEEDRAKMEKETHDFQMSESRKKAQWENEDRPLKVAQNKAATLKAEHELLRPIIASAMIKNQQAIDTHDKALEQWQAQQAQGPQQAPQPQFTPPEFSPEEIDAIMHLNKEAPLLDDDPKKAMAQVQALHGLQGVMQQITPALMQHAQGLPEGQRKVRISEQNAPGLVGNFNIAFSKMMGGKEAESFLLDMDAGTVVPIVSGGEKDQPSPLTQTHEGKEYIASIPLKVLQNYISQGQAFGNLLLPALAQTEGNEKLLESVQKASEARKLAQAKARALAEVPQDATPKQARQAYTTAMAKRGFEVKPAEAKELFDDPEAREAAKLEAQERLTDKKIEAADRALDKREEGADRRAAMREAHADARAERRENRAKKEKDEQARLDKYIKEAKADLKKDPTYSTASAEDLQERAEILAEARMRGEKAPPAPQGDRTVKDLSDWMRGFSTGMFGTDFKESIKGAIDEKGHSVASLKAAAAKMPKGTEADRKKQSEVLKAISDYENEKKPARSGMDSRPAASTKGSNEMPPASNYKGKILRDKMTNKRYKSDGKRWNELS